MHVLLICRSFPHHRTGGMEWHVHDVAEGLMEAGATVSVITTPLPETPALAPLRVNGEVLQPGRTPGAYDVRFLLDFRREARRFVRRLRPDAIHAQGFAGMIAHPLLRREAPVLTTIHGTLWSETLPGRLHLKRRLLSPAWKRFLRSGAPLIVDSEFTAGELRREAGPSVRPAAVVPLGFDMARFPPLPREEARREWDIPEGTVLIAAAGRLEPQKGMGDLLRAHQRAPASRRTRLVIAGEGSLLPDLRRAAGEGPLAGRIELPGRLPSGRLASLLRAADLFVNLDRGRPAFGLANAEALCMGTPVLTTDAGAHREVLRGAEDGTLVPRESPEEAARALADWLARLPETEPTRDERATAARERFARQRMVEGLIRAYGG